MKYHCVMKMLSRKITITTPCPYVVNSWRCPECAGITITWKRGSRWAGVWECVGVCGTSDSCEHPDTRVESVQVDHWPTPDIDNSYDRDVYVCNICDETIDLDQADPAVDAYEARVDSQIMEALGK
jgi:hypothetical protein